MVQKLVPQIPHRSAKFVLVFAFLAANYGAFGIKIDNQLVSSPNDCFVRIALGAMMPFESTFRNSDTNLLKVCEDLCAREGPKCQTFAFGIHVRGNGTCQLSADKVYATKTRPVGTIFDPDFDMYARQDNCLPGGTSQLPPFPGGLESTNQPSSTFPTGSERPSSQGPSFGTSEPGDPTTMIDGGGDGGTSTPTFPTTYHPSSLDTRYPDHTVTERYPGSSYPSTIEYERDPYNRYPDNFVYGSSRPSSAPSSPSGYDGYYDQQPGKYPPPHSTKDRLYLHYNTNPSNNGYDNKHNDERPVLYEKNYPAPNGYPNRNTDYPNRNTDYPNRNTEYPNRNSGYSSSSNSGYSGSNSGMNNGYSGSSSGMNNGYSGSNSGMNNGYSGSSSPMNNGYSGSNSGMNNGYSGSNSGHSGMNSGYSGSNSAYSGSNSGQNSGYSGSNSGYSGSNSGSNSGYSGSDHKYLPEPRPSPPSPSYSSGGGSKYPDSSPSGNYPSQSSSSKYPPRPNKYPNQSPAPVNYYQKGDNRDRTGVPNGPGGNYFVTEEPDRYPNNDKFKPPYEPSGGSSSGSYGQQTSSGQGHRPESGMSCFRRVLAGKRVSPQWVRKTLSCERLEDCQRECSEEKRFICEGFNYKLDPSGRGQGNCELMEVPLSELDLYSSPYSRESTLLNHPDYDYFERDRNNSPSCRIPPSCTDCGSKSSSTSVDYYRPQSGGGSYRPEPYKPSYQEPRPNYEPYRPSQQGFDRWDYNRYDHSTSLDIYRPSHYEFSSSGSGYRGPPIDRYDVYRPERPTSSGSYSEIDLRPDYRPPESGYYESHRPSLNKPRPSYGGDYYEFDRYIDRNPPSRPNYIHIDRDGGYGASLNSKPSSNFIPYLIGQSTYGSYGSSGHTSEHQSQHIVDYWGLKGSEYRKEGPSFNYFELGGGSRYHNVPEENSVWNYPGSRYGYESNRHQENKQRVNYATQWTRRPGSEDCSAKSSEGFRLHKGVIRFQISVPTVTECERMCASMETFKCHTYSFRYSGAGSQNCQLCDRPYNLLDYYADIEPDRDYDIYSMTDDLQICRNQPKDDHRNNAQCFFKAIDANRFYKSIVRDSLTVRSIGECELECIKSQKFTCRAFTFRYGPQTRGNVIDNCQLSDWPVRDMDKKRHLVPDPAYDIYERASYGHGCELQPIVDPKHQKLCYLGYGSAAKLLSSAIKKIVSVGTELECKNECIRLRENSIFKCYSFSYGSEASSFNCEMSDLDQSELKENIHFAHTTDRDYWLFAWNPFDMTCRDKVTTQGGGNRVDNGRRMDIFKESGDAGKWRQFTVSGQPCRKGSKCERNLITGFHSCEVDGGEVGAWDYCCKEDHPCGYSQGFEYPWCFVGDKPDQWRNCSDRYFPSATSTDNDDQPAQTSESTNTVSNKYQVRPTKKKGSSIYQSPPRPGGLQSLNDFSAARLWPITFLYNDPPPNSTELSNFVDCKKEDDC